MSVFIFVTTSTPSLHKGNTLILRDVENYSEILRAKMLVQVLKRASVTDYRMTEELMGSLTIIARSLLRVRQNASR